MKLLTARLALLAALGLAALLLGAGSAAAASPWWHLTLNTRASILPSAPGSKGEVILTAANVGTADVDGTATPVTFTDTLPVGLKAKTVSSVAGLPGGGNRGPVECGHTTSVVTCTFEGTLPPYDVIEIRIRVEVLAGAQSGALDEATVSGGGPLPGTVTRPLAFSEEPVPFGLDRNEFAFEEEGGEAPSQAGSHPFQVTDALNLNESPGPLNGATTAMPAALIKDVHANLPPGLAGNPTPFPTCTLAQFLTILGFEENECAPNTALGVAMITVNVPNPIGTGGTIETFTIPIFNLEPAFGEPARFGFSVPFTPVILETSLRSGEGTEREDYGVTVSSVNISQTVPLLASQVTFWGTPGDSRHDAQRGWGCLNAARGLSAAHFTTCEPSPDEPHPPAFLTLPTSCTGPMPSDVRIDSWAEPQNPLEVPLSRPLGTLDGCNKLPFNPAVQAEPTSNAATTGTGLAFNLSFNNDGLTDASAEDSESQIKKAIVALPEGFTTNPSVAEGLKACSEQEYKAATVEIGSGCTPESKIGEVEVESPLIEAPGTQEKVVKGGLFVAEQGENPYHNLLTLYLIARDRELGILVKQALKVEANEHTGQLTTSVDNIPQLPFSHFRLQFRSGQRSPLVTPPACGTYAVQADLFPWSDPSKGVERESAFQITEGPEGQPCPSGGTPPFHPTLEAGTQNNAAGTYSPFYTRISRKDSEQEITHFSIKLPPGVTGKLAGIAKCPDAAIAAAKAREHEGGGAEELASPSCPASSEIGRTVVGTGVGNVLAYAPGKLYLAGPYKGSNLSIVSVTAAKVGPFDLGTVVVREALKVNPETAQVSAEGAGSDPIPHIVDGIPVHLRDIRIYVDRPNFVLNPTSCERMSTASTVLGSGLDFASEADDQPVTVTSPFQAADCASLGFRPKLKLTLKGGRVHRGGLPAFKAVLHARPGDANIGKAQVTLPASEILEQGHLEDVCPKSIWTQGSVPGENCPASSIYGSAKAVTPLLSEPLRGPVYLRTGYGTRLPELVAALNGEEINVDVVGIIDAVHKKGSEISRLRTTFDPVPDAPVSEFTLEMKGGKKGLLVNTTNICHGTHRALAAFTGQNGKLDELEPVVKAPCGKKGGAKKKHRRRG